MTATSSLHVSRRLSRSPDDGRPPAPVRVAHLGLGSVVRVPRAWHSEHAPDARVLVRAATVSAGYLNRS